MWYIKIVYLDSVKPAVGYILASRCLRRVLGTAGTFAYELGKK